MRKLLSVYLLLILSACSAPNDAASNRTSTLPMSRDPSTTLPGTGAQPPYNAGIDHDSSRAGAADSTNQVIRVDSVPPR